MPDATKVLLTDDDRAKLKKAREGMELLQEQAGLKAWPHMTPDGAKAACSRLETNTTRATNVTTLVPLLEALGLELTGTMKIKQVKV